MKSRLSKTRLPTAQKNLICPQCGDDGIKTYWHRHAFQYGSGVTAVELVAHVPVRCCSACEFQYLDDEGERLKHEAVCEHLRVLSPTQVRRIREIHQMTRAKFAEVTGLGSASLNRWENGLTIQTHANDRYIRLLERPEIMQLLKKIVDARESPKSALRTGVNRFRTLEVTDAVLKRQRQFRLRRAA